MHLIPNHRREQELLDAIGASSLDTFFAGIPQALRCGPLELPPAEPEADLVRRLHRVLGKNRSYRDMPIFLGGGNKPQNVPAAVQAVIHRQELKNSYTPYQAEVSQGLLQSLFEYQSLMCDITRMEVANASMYDHATALGEAVLMATRANGRTRFLVPRGMSWQKRSVAQNYARGAGITLESYGYDDASGRTDLEDLKARLGSDVSGVYLENPNHFGVFEEHARAVGEAARDAGALFVMGVDPTSLGVVLPPGALGADIAIGEASCFGGAPALGGPLLGLFACREALVRRMPGRLIGVAKDADGKRGYVMTLQAREQHIRRSKATSNICSNEALIANQAAMHLAMLGRRGLRTMGLQNLAAGVRLGAVLAEAGLPRRFEGAVYNELVTRVDDPKALHEALLAQGVHGGAALGHDDPALDRAMLWGATPVHGDWEFQRLTDALARVEVPA